jgi:hypothetical protein
MATAARTVKSFSLEPAVFKAVERTRGSASRSERVNALLKAGLEAEKRLSLHSEAAAFFRDGDPDDGLHDAFHQAAVEAMARPDGVSRRGR